MTDSVRFFRRVIILSLAALLLLLLWGCQTARVSAPGKTGPSEGFPGAPKSLAYFHYLKAQRLLLEDNSEGAITEYLEALKYDAASAQVETELAAIYQRQGKVKQALEHVEKALKLDPGYQEAHFLLAGLHVGLRQLKEATREYEHILKLDPENREARLFLATLYAQQRQFDKAILAIKDLLRQDPKLTVAHYYLGRVYLETGNLAEARKEFNQVLALEPGFVPAMFDLATALERDKQYSRALAIYRRILKKQPANSRAWINIGRLMLATKHLAEAHKAFDKVRELEKSDNVVALSVGVIYLENNLPDEALREFSRLLDQPRFKDQAHYFMGLALEEKEDSKAAIKEYRLVEKGSESYVSARLRLAFLLHRAGQRAEAWAILDEVKTLAPDQEDVYLTFSYLYEEEKQWDKGIALIKQGLEKLPQSVELNFRLAAFHEKKPDREASIKQVKKVLELDPQNADAQNFLGYTYAEAGIHLDEAESLIRAALRAKPEAGYIIDSLGWLLYKKGQYDKAVAELERAFKKMPKDSTVAEHLGDALTKLRRYQEALEVYRKALGLENSNRGELEKKIKTTEQLLTGRAP